MIRSRQIKDKLEYAELQRQQLMGYVYDAKKAGIEAKHIVHSAAEILSTSRECYDYCANDIVENLIVQHTSNSTILGKYRSGRLRVYFPFYTNELTDSNNVFSELQYTNCGLHKHLVSLSQSISGNEQIPNTLFKYGGILWLKDMVNTKKHNSLICVQIIPNQEVLIEGAGVKILVPKKRQSGWNRFMVSAGSYVSNVSEFLFEYNNLEVSEFCLFAVKSTEIVLDKIYRKFFNSTIK